MEVDVLQYRGNYVPYTQQFIATICCLYGTMATLKEMEKTARNKELHQGHERWEVKSKKRLFRFNYIQL